ncbi:MAG: plastocyanin/azurin family copper-binding protein [Gaiellaceae bacterium]
MKLILATALLSLALAAPATSATSATTLTGTVGPGFTISLTVAGKKVSKLKAGTYTIKVSDKSSIHDFHLTGPGLSKSTSVGGTGAKTWIVKLKRGKYHYQCDPHASIMNGNFTVT